MMQISTESKSSRIPTIKHKLISFLKLIAGMIMFVCFLAFFSANWYVRTFGRLGFGAIVNTLTAPMEGAESGIIYSYLVNVVLAAVITPLLWYLLFGKVKFTVKIFNHKIYPFKKWISVILATVISLTAVANAVITSELNEYVANIYNKTTIYENEYSNPKEVKIKFPDKKRNLIYIFLESMETTYTDKINGGAMEDNLIPQLTKLAEENINFSHNSGTGGAREGAHSGWTVAAMVSQSAGIPFSENLYGPSFKEDKSFLNGATTLGDILSKNGYYQALMVGSDANFANRDNYYMQHGANKIYDYNTAIADGIIPEDYYVWWGMEDACLYEYAKKEIKKISKSNEPFAFTMLTVDTHFPDGFVCRKCNRNHSNQYDNVISCASSQLYDFVEWLKIQDFYDDTTIVISGDHCSMNNEYINKIAHKDYPRRIYNCIINSVIPASRTKNRDFTTMDMFPTTLAAMGCTIEGEKLGLGVNLFSNEETLTEKYGHDYLTKELESFSPYYLENIMLRNQTAIMHGNATIGYVITHKNGVRLFPVRATIESLGGQVNWEDSKTVVKLNGIKYKIDTSDCEFAEVTYTDKSQKNKSNNYMYTITLDTMYIEEDFFKNCPKIKYKTHKNKIVFE